MPNLNDAVFRVMQGFLLYDILFCESRHGSSRTFGSLTLVKPVKLIPENSNGTRNSTSKYPIVPENDIYTELEVVFGQLAGIVSHTDQTNKTFQVGISPDD